MSFCKKIFTKLPKNELGCLVGLEYVVEIQDGDMNAAAWYSCRLCNSLYNPKEGTCTDNMRLHLSSNSHRIKYLVGIISDYCIEYLVI